ncbi:PH domain-containing protein [Brachybacterium vulturis]|uniref:PH domain-containing protein n=1 Tax=Brachybacterium vulturis TaxID=2017484 RepID=UPI003734ECF3
MSTPDHGGAEPESPSAPVAPAEPGATAVRRRTHPITPLVTGWKIVVGVIAVLTAQNIARLVEDFTVTRALIGTGMLVVVVVIAIVLSALSWWFTTYAVDEAGVSLYRGMISRSREYAPRARIESVSVERPLLARLLGLAKVRVEVAGGGDSYLDIEYVRSGDAEQLRRGILDVAALDAPSAPARETEHDPAAGSEATSPEGDRRAPSEGPGAADPQVSAQRPAGHPLERFLHDDVTDGELIARIPTRRLVHSLLRDPGFLLSIVGGVVGVLAAIGLTIRQDGVSFAILVALLPTAIAIPKYVFGRIESGWGFVSRITERGLRMRRGLATTRTDNIAAGRIQRFELRRPLLWRSPDWTGVSVTVAGIEDSEENGAAHVLPVGTREELRATLGHLAAPLGTPDDPGTIEQLLSAPAREIDGLRTPVRGFWISRRTRVAVLLPGALVQRSGVLTRRLEIIPRERLQGLTVQDGPFARKLGVLDLQAGVAGETMVLSDLPRRDVLALHAVLARDAATLRRYRDREHWPQPALAVGGAPAGPAGGPQ